ncbi:MAG TPA: inner membrane-spanning protein YciB [Steroidobacteraceae bacterium]|nr:inner membrane-spanning protein YciB [Steroidobacteraceae bacterium]
MQTLVDFLPLIAFWVSLKLAGIYVATGVFIVACAGQIAWHRWKTGKVKTLHWVMGVLVLVFGLATLLLRDPRYIQWKTSIFLWVVGVAFLVSHFVGAKPLAQRFLESVLGEHLAPRPARTWHTLNIAWVAFLGALGALNLYVAYNFSQSTWADYKVFGQFVLMLAFVFPQVLWLMPKEQPAESGK